MSMVLFSLIAIVYWAKHSVTVQSGKYLRFVILRSFSFSALQIFYNPDNNGLPTILEIAGIEIVLVLTEHSENNVE